MSPRLAIAYPKREYRVLPSIVLTNSRLPCRERYTRNQTYKVMVLMGPISTMHM